MLVRFLSLDRIALVAEERESWFSLESWNNCFEQKSTKIARWSLFVTQLKGAYPIVLIMGRTVGEQKIASMRCDPREYVLKFGSVG